MFESRNIAEAAKAIHDLGLVPIPLEHRGKVCRINGWPTRTHIDFNIEDFKSGANLGVLTGPWNNAYLCDIDLDSSSAREIATIFLPDTVRFGRSSLGYPSHYLFRVPERFESRRYRLNLPTGPAMVLEVRGEKHQTMIPPSIHPSGEEVVWMGGPKAPAEMSNDTISRLSSLIFASAVLGERWPKAPGIRHQAALALAGAMARWGLNKEEGTKVIKAVCLLSKDSETLDRVRCWEDTLTKHSEGAVVTGLPSLINFLGEDSKEALTTIDSCLRGKLNETLTANKSPKHEYKPRLGTTSRVDLDFSDDGAPIPLIHTNRCPAPYPLEALGPILGDAAKAIAEVVAAPQAICAQSVLGAASLVSQYQIDVELNGRVIPTSLFLASVAESGDRKTAVDKCALDPIRMLEKEDFCKYEEKLKARAAWEARQKQKPKTKDRASDSKKTDTKNLDIDVEPEIPICPNILSGDPTYEGLVKLLIHGRGFGGLFTDEAGKLIGGYSFNVENQLKTASAFSDLWQGNPIDRVRSMEPTEKAYNRRLAMHLMMQPIVLNQIYSNPVLSQQGLLGRILTVESNSLAGTRFYQDLNIYEDARYLRYRDTIAQRYLLTPRYHQRKVEGLNISRVFLSDGAKSVYQDLYNKVEMDLGPGGPYHGIASFASKASEHCLRLAGVLHFIEDLEGSQISALNMSRAATLTKYYLDEAVRISDTYQVPQIILDSQKLLDWMKTAAPKENGILVLPAHIMRLGPRKFRTKKTLQELIQVLLDHKHILIRPNVNLFGKIRKEAYELRGIG